MDDLTKLPTVELVRRCVEVGDATIWQEFVRRFQPVISRAIIRQLRQWRDPASDLVDDLVQEAYLRLCASRCRALRTFQPEHSDSIYGYVQMVAANVARDHLKAALAQKRRPESTAETLEDEDAAVANPRERGGAQAIQHQLLMQEIAGFLAVCAAGPLRRRNETIFWLHHRLGMSPGEIARFPGIVLDPKGVESTIYRLTKCIRGRILAHEAFPPLPKQDRPPDEGILPAESF